MNFFWQQSQLRLMACAWLKKNHKRTSALASENSAWWSFIFRWHSNIDQWIGDFLTGKFSFSPMIQYHFKDESVRFWCYQDRMIIKLILGIIKPTFQHILHKRCYPILGPQGVKKALNDINRALTSHRYAYVIRADIKGYYSSISRHILLKQLLHHYQDPRLKNYFEQIVCCAVDKGGDVFVPKKGIPRRSSLSPFFSEHPYTSSIVCSCFGSGKSDARRCGPSRDEAKVLDPLEHLVV